MSIVYFSPTTLGFYLSAWRDDGTYTDENWPQDAILLTEEQSAPYFRQSPPIGKIIGSIDGMPAWVDIPIPAETPESVRSRRDSILNNIYDRGVLMAQREIRICDASDADRLQYLTGKLAELDAFAQALQEVPEQPGFPGNVVWPEQPQP